MAYVLTLKSSSGTYSRQETATFSSNHSSWAALHLSHTHSISPLSQTISHKHFTLTGGEPTICWSTKCAGLIPLMRCKWIEFTYLANQGQSFNFTLYKQQISFTYIPTALWGEGAWREVRNKKKWMKIMLFNRNCLTGTRLLWHFSGKCADSFLPLIPVSTPQPTDF